MINVPKEKLVVPIAWRKLMEGWVRLNTYGASKGGLGAGFSGIIRGSYGE
jgi:hypothetical protein